MVGKPFPLDDQARALVLDLSSDVPQTRRGDDVPSTVAVPARRPFLRVAGVSAVRASPHEGDPIAGWPPGSCPRLLTPAASRSHRQRTRVPGVQRFPP